MFFSSRIDNALIFAARAHEGQVRKGTEIPYFSHPASVAIILTRAGFDEDVVVAGILHDVVEDCDVSVEEIEAAFGPEVAELVRHSSEDKRLSWRARKQAQIDAALEAPDRLKAVKAADKLHNAQSIMRDHLSGVDVFSRFRVPREETLWYYREISRAISEGWDHPLAAELREAVSQLEGLRPEA